MEREKEVESEVAEEGYWWKDEKGTCTVTKGRGEQLHL